MNDRVWERQRKIWSADLPWAGNVIFSEGPSRSPWTALGDAGRAVV